MCDSLRAQNKELEEPFLNVPQDEMEKITQ